MNTAAILALADKGLSRVHKLEADTERHYEKFMSTIEPDQVKMRTYTQTGFGLFQKRNEDEHVTSDVNQGIYPQSWLQDLYALKATLPEYLSEKSSFDPFNTFSNLGKHLREAMIHTKNYLATKALIDGFTTFTSTDGQALFGTHTRYNGSAVSNTGTDDLSVSSLMDALQTIGANVNHRGIPMGLGKKGYTLLTGPMLSADAITICQSSGLMDRTDRADNVYIKSLISSCEVNPWISDSVVNGCGNNWFLMPGDKKMNPLNIVEYQPEKLTLQFIPGNLQMDTIGRFVQAIVAFGDAWVWGQNAPS